jgi:hypothetical protein
MVIMPYNISIKLDIMLATLNFTYIKPAWAFWCSFPSLIKKFLEFDTKKANEATLLPQAGSEYIMYILNELIFFSALMIYFGDKNVCSDILIRITFVASLKVFILSNLFITLNNFHIYKLSCT